jgi:hypothetical protein
MLADVWVMDHAGGYWPAVIEGDFEWDSANAESKLRKHRLSFFEAATVFADPAPVRNHEPGDKAKV